MWPPYPLYLWTLATLLFHTSIAEDIPVLRSYFVDPNCPNNVKAAIREAIFDLLPNVWEMKDDEPLLSIMAYIYPEMNPTTLKGLFRMHISPLSDPDMAIRSLLTVSPNEGDIRMIGVNPEYANSGRLYGRGLYEIPSASDSDIAFYCDDDERWVHPGPNIWSNPEAWYDSVNGIIYDVEGKPGCMQPQRWTGAQTYRGMVVRNPHQPPRYKATITLCSGSYNGVAHTGFYSFKSDGARWPDFSGPRRPNIDSFRLLSLTIVHQVRFHAFFRHSKTASTLDKPGSSTSLI